MKLKLLLVLFFCKVLVFGQQETSYWYFGYNAGIHFDINGNVTALTDGKLATNEGCSTISDENGNLLFYTDGVKVYNKNHIVMSNGYSLLGNNSTTQSATIVNLPNSTNLFYIFTLDAFAGNNGLRYSIVDTNLDGGLGNVTTVKNVLVYTPSYEKLSIVKKSNNIDYWIVSHDWNSNDFYSYSLTSLGLNSSFVTSSVGLVINNSSTDNALGYMKISPDGTKIATCNYAQGILQLFDFNDSTGVISNPQTLFTGVNLYGLEFSPNSQVLYFTDEYSLVRIYQCDLNAVNISNSIIILFDGTPFATAMQLGPNNKIYFGEYGTNKLGVINNPDVVGTACNLQLDAIDLLTGSCIRGLPQFVNSYFNAAFTATNLCLGDTTNFTINSSQPILNATWNFDDGTTSSTPNATHQFATPGTYNVSVTATTANGTSTKTKIVRIVAKPIIAATIMNKNICGKANDVYDLLQHNSTLLGLQPTANFGVAYFANNTDLANHTNILSNNFVMPIGETTFYAKVFNLQNTNCYANTSFKVTLFKQPIANTLTDYVICESMPYNNIEQFDLSTKNAQLLGNQSSSQFAISYYASQNDADTKNAPLPNLYNNVLATENIYYRIENINNAECYATKKLTLKVIQQPSSIAVSDFKKCDDASNNGLETFDLSLKTIEILNGQSDVVFQVKYYKNNTDATNNTSEITNPITNTTNNQIIYYVISAIGNIGCKTISSFNLVVNQFPKIIAVKDIFNCDDITNDGFGVFYLQSNNPLILGSQAANDFEIKYFLSQADADSDNAPLAFNYPNISNPQTIFARIQNKSNNLCFATKSFQIGLYKLPKANKPIDLITCDDSSNYGKETVDLSIQNSKILLLQNAADFNITYHTNQNDPNSGLIYISNIYTNTSNLQTIYARIENKLNKTCFDTTTFNLIVRDKPNVIMPDNYSICEGKNVSVTAPNGFDSYTWSNGSAAQQSTFTTAGDYSLIVTKDYGDIICNDIKNIKIYNSNVATITNIEVKDWSDSENIITIFVTGDGDYEYSIDGNTYQDSQQFFGLPNGKYTVYVKDKRGCGIAKEEDVFLLMYPKFFTPNADGINDNWQIKFSEIEPNMKLSIFDRFGKLITEFFGNNQGWNGNLNSTQLPSDDYWFVVNRENGKEYKGHFSLKR